jgi:dCTP deaminase
VILSDRSIREEIDAGRLRIDPLDLDRLQSASIDLRLSDEFLVTATHSATVVDLTEDQSKLSHTVTATRERPFILHPDEFVLGATLENISLPDDLVGRLEGRSSVGRAGLLVHSTAGYVDPGWSGKLTLELFNVATLPIALWPGLSVAQFSLARMTTPADRPYGSPGLNSKYMGQTGPTATRFHLD